MAKGLTKATLGGKLLHPSEYVAAVEFQGKDVTLTIAAVQLEQLQIQGGRKESKPTISFKETKKKLVVNKTNASVIAELYGTKAEEWIGKKITMYPTRTTCGRDTVDCIRIRERRPGEKEAPPPPAMDDPPEAEGDDIFTAQQSSGKSIGDENATPPALENA